MQLHVHYKQAMYGDCTMGVPLRHDIVTFSKFTEWNNLQGMSERDAQRKYVELVEKYLKQYKEDIAGRIR